MPTGNIMITNKTGNTNNNRKNKDRDKNLYPGILEIPSFYFLMRTLFVDDLTVKIIDFIQIEILFGHIIFVKLMQFANVQQKLAKSNQNKKLF